MSGRARSSAVYVYGFVRSNLDLDLGSIGIGEEGAPARVYTLSAGRVAALVSAQRDPSPPLPSRRDLVAHHRVIALAMEAGTILPLAFGQVARNEREVLRHLRAQERFVFAELDRLNGKVQMRLRVCWQVDDLYQSIVDADPKLAELRDRIFGSPDPPTFDERVDLGRRFEACLDAKREMLVESLLSGLPVTEPPKALSVRSLESIADLMFLIERSERGAFEESVGHLAAAWPSEFAFRLTGPWAPFNFVELRSDS